MVSAGEPSRRTAARPVQRRQADAVAGDGVQVVVLEARRDEGAVESAVVDTASDDGPPRAAAKHFVAERVVDDAGQERAVGLPHCDRNAEERMPWA
jgi:hypothetical protein